MPQSETDSLSHTAPDELRLQSASMTPAAIVRRPSLAWPFVLLAVVLAALATGLTIYFQVRPTPMPVLFDAPSFELTAQNGQSISTSRDLRGKVWIGNFFFANCAGPCPRMTAALAAVLDDTESNRVRGISISVDPKNDTPAELLKYARRFDADPAQWLFLTEPGDDYVKIAAGFKVLASPAEGARPIFHSEKFFLVDGAGKVRGIYSHNSQEEMNQLTTDIGRLLGE